MNEAETDFNLKEERKIKSDQKMVSYDSDEEVEDISEEEWEDCDVEDDMPLLENHVEESKSFEVIDPTASSEF